MEKDFQILTDPNRTARKIKMFQKMLTKVFGSKEDRDVKKFRDIVEAVNQREPDVQKLTDAQLQSKTPEFRQQLDAGHRSMNSYQTPSPSSEKQLSEP